jgi:hypothetical protein
MYANRPRLLAGEPCRDVRPAATRPPIWRPTRLGTHPAASIFSVACYTNEVSFSGRFSCGCSDQTPRRLVATFAHPRHALNSCSSCRMLPRLGKLHVRGQQGKAARDPMSATPCNKFQKRGRPASRVHGAADWNRELVMRRNGGLRARRSFCQLQHPAPRFTQGWRRSLRSEYQVECLRRNDKFPLRHALRGGG